MQMPIVVFYNMSMIWSKIVIHYYDTGWRGVQPFNLFLIKHISSTAIYSKSKRHDKLLLPEILILFKSIKNLYVQKTKMTNVGRLQKSMKVNDLRY